MALDERELKSEQFLDLACGTENLSPYSSPPLYSDQSSYYQTDYDWQQQQQQQQQQQHHSHHLQQHQQQMAEHSRHFFNLYPEGADMATHTYAGYNHQAVTGPSDYYTPPGALWAAGQVDAVTAGQMNPSHRFFSGIDLAQQTGTPRSTSTGQNGKPKRKRVQSHMQRKAANVRERRRMFHLNEAFDELRKRLPAFNYEKRLSRIETLRLAMTYISFMKEVSVGQDPKCIKLKPHGTDLSSPPLADPHGLISASHSSCSDNNDDGLVNDDSDCSVDDHSNHSAGN